MPRKEKQVLTDQDKLDLLVEFGWRVSHETNLDALLNLTVKQVSKILGVKRCFIFIKDEQAGVLWSKTVGGKGLEYTEIHLPLEGKSAAAAVCLSGHTLNIPDIYADKRFSNEIDMITGFKTNSILAVPLKSKENRTIGVLQVNNKNDASHFSKKEEGLLKLIANLAAGKIEIAKLYDDVKLSNLETIYRLAVTAEYRDQADTKKHIANIGEVSYQIAKGLGMKEEQALTIKNASILHDIGKIAIPDSILLKPGKLTQAEFDIMKSHTIYGGKILEDAKSPLLKVACKMSLYHHEKFDGSGYPEGLKGEDIPLEARIVAAADVFDALCMPRCYKQPWEVSRAYDFILEQSGFAFDPIIVKAFKKNFNKIKVLYKDI